MSWFNKKPKPDSDILTDENEESSIISSIENPFLNSRRTWNTHIGSVVSSRQTWQVIGILSLLIALGSVGGLIYIGSKSKFIPYIVEVDKHGQTIAVGPATETGQADPRIVLAEINSFITNARLVTPDIQLQRKAILKVYSMLSRSDPATQKMNDWLNGTEESSPFVRAQKETVNVEVVDILPQSDRTWQIEWIEHTYDREGNPSKPPFHMKALLTIYIAKPNPSITEEEQRNNPIRLFIEDFNWTKQL